MYTSEQKSLFILKRYIYSFWNIFFFFLLDKGNEAENLQKDRVFQLNVSPLPFRGLHWIIRSYFQWYVSCFCVDSMDTYTYNQFQFYILIACYTMWI